VLAIRKLRHEQLQKQLFLAQKNAHLRSGSRGLQARKELKAIEAKVATSQNLLDQDPMSIDAETITIDTKAAVELMEELQSQYDAVS
jgi:hypothetical protein